MRFYKCRICCHCNSTDVVRNGKNNGIQRYLCTNCISRFIGVGSVDDVGETDEFFFKYPYKGTKPVNIPRPSRKRAK